MVDTSKCRDYFNPLDEKFYNVHIIGIGAIGSTIAVNLARMGVPQLSLYDFDHVEPKNISNQQYFQKDVGKTKLEALTDTLKEINPEIVIDSYPEGWTQGIPLYGHVILAVDNIELRKAIVTDIKDKWEAVMTIQDYRMGLTDAQHYMCDKDNIEVILKSMQFTHAEAKEAQPISACGTTLNIITTVNTIVALGLNNLIQYTRAGVYKKLITIDLAVPDIFFI